MYKNQINSARDYDMIQDNKYIGKKKVPSADKQSKVAFRSVLIGQQFHRKRALVVGRVTIRHV